MEDTWKMAQRKTKSLRLLGINAALFSAFFLGLAPIFGKQAIEQNFSPLGVVASRTVLATGLLFVVVAIFQRKFLYIYPAGLLGCFLAGFINGIGSLFYYSALGRIDAGVGQLLYSLYPFFVAFWMFLDHHPPTRLTILRLVVAIPAVFLLIQTGTDDVDLVGVIMMLTASALYALHLPINQRVLYDIPAPTVTLYTLIAMSAVVVPTYLFSDTNQFFPTTMNIWWPVLGLTLVTFFSRLTLFTGIKHLGGMQTALLGLGELLVAIVLSQTWLKEQLDWPQWIGAALLTFSLLLITWEKPQPPRNRKGGWFSWISAPPGIPPSEIPRQLEANGQLDEFKKESLPY
jgi:drug/metabolite transporter (DMT)-like permease